MRGAVGGYEVEEIFFVAKKRDKVKVTILLLELVTVIGYGFLETLFTCIYKEISAELWPRNPNKNHATLSSSMVSLWSVKLRCHASLHSSISRLSLQSAEKVLYTHTVHTHICIQTCIYLIKIQSNSEFLFTKLLFKNYNE